MMDQMQSPGAMTLLLANFEESILRWHRTATQSFFILMFRLPLAGLTSDNAILNSMPLISVCVFRAVSAPNLSISGQLLAALSVAK